MRALLRPLIALSAAAVGVFIFQLPEPRTALGFGQHLDRTIFFGLASTVFLYLCLLAGAVADVFERLPFRDLFRHAQRPLGLAAFGLGALHSYDGFFGWVGGIEGAKWWSADYNVALAAGFVALLITLAMAVTSFDGAMKWLGAKWKRLHRGVYWAAVLVFAHAMAITIHVLDLKPWLIGAFVAVLVLLVLEVVRVRRVMNPGVRRELICAASLLSATLVSYWSFFLISHHRH